MCGIVSANNWALDNVEAGMSRPEVLILMGGFPRVAKHDATTGMYEPDTRVSRY